MDNTVRGAEPRVPLPDGSYQRAEYVAKVVEPPVRRRKRTVRGVETK